MASDIKQNKSLLACGTPLSFLSLCSSKLAKIELKIAALCLIIVFGLLLLNVVTRSIGMPYYWVDEAAIFAMCWMALFAASAAIQSKNSISVNLLIDKLPEQGVRVLLLLVDVVMILFFLAMVYMCWNWFDPIGLYKNNWNVDEFSFENLNFIYQEPTMTLGASKFWFWLAVPLFSLFSLFHSTINFLENISSSNMKEDA